MSSAALILTLLGSAAAVYNGTVGDDFPCWNVTVLHDHKNGWNDGCLGLKYKKNVTSSEACGLQCKNDPECIIWQWVDQAVVKGNNKTDKECWSGNDVHGCKGRSPTPGDAHTFDKALLAGQRLQHGSSKVLIANFSTSQVLHLKNYEENEGTEAEKIARCRIQCHSDVSCGVWQYGDNKCWVEHWPGNKAGEVNNNSAFADSIVAGEKIEHTCPPKPEPDEGLPWPLIIASCILGLLALAAIAYALQKKPKVKKTRAVKIEAKPEPQPVMYFIPQPTVLIPQTSVVQMAPQYTPLMTQQTAPVVTYTQAGAYELGTPTTITQATPLVSGGIVS